MKTPIQKMPVALKSLLLSVLLMIGCLSGHAVSTTSKGTDFWLMFNGNGGGGPTLTLFITSTVNTSGTVSGASFVSIPFTVTANTVTPVVVPTSLASHVSDVVDNKGIHVTSVDEITVYGLNYVPFTTDAYLGLPTDVLGTDYIVTSYASIPNFGWNSSLGIVGTVNGTSVAITPSVTVGAHTAGVPYMITLNQGQAYELLSGSTSADLTGTIISATQPVGVMGANQCANIPVTASFCDHICEMLPPTSTWGKKFGAVPLKSRINGDTWRFMASTNGTTVSINGVAQSPVLNAGQFMERNITTASIIESDKPILATQYSNGSSFSGNPGDPFMMMIPPLEQFLGDYTIINVAGYSSQFINIIAPNAIVGSITLDAATIPAAAFTPIGASGYSSAQITTTTGQHHLASTQPFGVFIYGFNTNDSYGYPGGQSFAPVASADTVILSLIGGGSDDTGTTHCWTALVLDSGSLPLAGIVVNFNVLGANPLSSGFATSDTDGIAQFCYTGHNAGLDSIIASVGTLRDTSHFLWLAGPLGPDTSAPVISGCPGNFAVFTGPGNTDCRKAVTWTPPTYSDQSPVTVTASHTPGDSFSRGSTLVTYLFVDSVGNRSYCWFYVSVIDNTPPAVSGCPGNMTVFTGPGNVACRQKGMWTPPTAVDNCSTVNTIFNYSPTSWLNTGTTMVTYIFRDAVNNSSTCSFNVTVIDNTPPIANCKPYTLTLSGGTGTVTPANINNSSFDNCGIASMTVSPSTFTCAQAGTVQPAVLTVTDLQGNSSTCTAMVTVRYKPTCAITVTPSNTTYTGGVPTNIYLGYGPQSARAAASASGGSGFTYSWSPSTNLSCTNCFNPLFTPTGPGTFTYTVTVTNSNGCSTTCTVTFCVKDVRVPGSSNVYICHAGTPSTTMSVTPAQAASHLSSHPSDYLGMCDQVCAPGARLVKSNTGIIIGQEVKVYPNPNNGSFVIDLPAFEDQAQITVTDVQGKVIARKTVTEDQSNRISMDLGAVAKGMYFVEVVYSDQHFRTKLIIE